MALKVVEGDYKAGLEGVVAAQTNLSDIDGQNGVLTYCGYDIHDLAENATFEEVIHLLWHQRLPSRRELQHLTAQLEEESDIPKEILDLLRRIAPRLSGMGMLRTFVSMLAH